MLMGAKGLPGARGANGFAAGGLAATGGGWKVLVGATWGGAGENAGATGAGGRPVGMVSGERPGWRGNVTRATPRQSFHVSVASGGTGGFPWKVASKTARFTSLPAGIRSSEARTSSSCACTSVAAAISVDPGGTT